MDLQTNSVESFWRLFKASVRSTHIHVVAKYMDRYLAEFTFRSNHREMENAMFDFCWRRFSCDCPFNKRHRDCARSAGPIPRFSS